jgi:uncharacterized membrane protein YqiK
MQKQLSPAVVGIIIAVVILVIIVVGFLLMKGKKTDPMPQNAQTIEDMSKLGMGKGMGLKQGGTGSSTPGGQMAPGGGQ